MQDKMRSWRTTISGISAIVVAVAGFLSAVVMMDPLDLNQIIQLGSAAAAAVMAGVGLIMGKDANVSHSPEKKALPE